MSKLQTILKFRTNAALAIFIGVLFSLPQTKPLSTSDLTTFGTLILALGNSNGIVVVTDSMASYRDASGTHQSPTPAQKLLKYDEHTVCAIAGLGSARVHVAHELDADILGVVQSYRDEVERQGLKQPIASALQGLSAVLQTYLGGIAELNAQAG
ncbi:MAG: hypothetical protein ACREBQ_06150, partial [Nitrososphaerales archaeon]